MKAAKSKYLKTGNRKWLVGYVCVQFVIFAIFAGLIAWTFNDTNGLLKNIRNPHGLFSLLAIPLTIILEGLIHSDNKARLVFLRIKNCMPGCRAFSKIAVKDSRIDMEKLKSLFPDGFPNEPALQNKAWYKLYRQYNENVRVLEAHRAFLLTRDLAALTLIFIPISLTAHLILETTWSGILQHILLLITFLVIMILSAQSYGKRFVANVLVEATLA